MNIAHGLVTPSKLISPLQWGFDKESLIISCLDKKVCCVSLRSRRTSVIHIHHADAIGRGFNRITYDDSKHKKIPLHAEFHHIAHNMDQEEFEKKYGVFGVIYNTNENDPIDMEA